MLKKYLCFDCDCRGRKSEWTRKRECSFLIGIIVEMSLTVCHCAQGRGGGAEHGGAEDGVEARGAGSRYRSRSEPYVY